MATPRRARRAACAGARQSIDHTPISCVRRILRFGPCGSGLNFNGTGSDTPRLPIEPARRYPGCTAAHPGAHRTRAARRADTPPLSDVRRTGNRRTTRTIPPAPGQPRAPPRALHARRAHACTPVDRRCVASRPKRAVHVSCCTKLHNVPTTPNAATLYAAASCHIGSTSPQKCA